MSTPVLRHLAPGDEALIFNSWLKSYKSQQDRDDTGLPGWMYWRYYHEKIESLLKSAETRVLCDMDLPSFIFGWICFERAPAFSVVHYIYVKSGFRRIGLARMMITQADLDCSSVVYTFQSKTAKDLAAAKCEAAEFVPIDKWLDK
jgi:hypothetical protein